METMTASVFSVYDLLFVITAKLQSLFVLALILDVNAEFVVLRLMP